MNIAHTTRVIVIDPLNPVNANEMLKIIAHYTNNTAKSVPHLNRVFIDISTDYVPIVDHIAKLYNIVLR